jgi:hypothetical protein
MPSSAWPSTPARYRWVKDDTWSSASRSLEPERAELELVALEESLATLTLENAADFAAENTAQRLL